MVLTAIVGVKMGLIVRILRRNAEALRLSEQRSRTILEVANDPYIEMDDRGVITEWNNKAVQVFGWSRDEAVGRRLSDTIVPAQHQAAHEAGVERMRMHGEARILGQRLELPARCRDGREIPVELTVWRTGDSGVALYHAFVRDISDRYAAQEALRHQALHDGLTGIPNRTLFADRLQHALRRTQRDGSQLAVLFVDLDDFKVVNDGVGHPAGDELLRQMAVRLRGCLREIDTVARLGGDEFAVLMERVESEQEASRIAQRILARISQPLDLDRKRVVVHASAGIALNQAGSDTAEELLRNADLAMYAAKARGKNRVALFSPEMHQAVVDRLDLAEDLRCSFARDQLSVHYQPIVCLESGHISGAEAQLRWTHHSRGPVSPAEFIPVAEETGLIGTMGEWVLRTACAQARRWHGRHPRHRPLTISVNVSVHQWQEPGFYRLVEHVLDETGLDPTALVLELTEHVLLEVSQETIQRMRGLHALGVRFAVDDFGTGYSSLSYLCRFPVDILKIDRTFFEVTDVTDEAVEQEALAHAIVQLGRTLKLQVVAEGVKHAAQAKLLREWQCDQAQGFLFAGPLEIGDMDALLAQTVDGSVPWIVREPAREHTLSESPSSP